MTFKTISKTFSLLFLGGLVVSFGAYIGVRAYYISVATDKAQHVLSRVVGNKEILSDQDIINLTKEAALNFKAGSPSDFLLLRLRPYLTNKRLPNFLRYPDGAIETLVGAGACDNAVRNLMFLLRNKGYESRQWNMVTASDAHSALVVFMPEGRQVFVDPFLGYIARPPKTKRLISPLEAKELILSGVPQGDIFVPLIPKKTHSFYKNFARGFMEAQGEPLVITARLPLIKSEAIIWGELDGKSEDVTGRLRQNGMTPYWHYVGHKYNREWVRVLRARSDVRVEMILVRNPESGVLTMTPGPEIEGRKLTWYLKAGESVTFRDGPAKISWARMNSYIDVDQIVMRPAFGKQEAE